MKNWRIGIIDADGVDLAERTALRPPGDDVLDRIENVFPGRAKGRGGWLHDRRRPMA